MSLTTKKAFLISLAFNAYWLLCVVFQMQYWPIMVAVLLLALAYEKTAILALPSIALIGIATDFLFTLLGVFSFDSETSQALVMGFPLWLVFLWLGFSIFAWLMRKIVLQSYLPLLLLVCGVAGASSYYAGFQLGVVDFPMGLAETLSILFVAWVILAGTFIFVIRFLSQTYFNEQFDDLPETA